MDSSFIVFLTCVFIGMHCEYMIVQKNVTIDYKNSSVLDVSAKIYHFNKSATALGFTFKLKRALTVQSKITIRAIMWMNDDYQLSLFQMDQPIVRLIAMETFDIQRLCLEYTRPAIMWPIQTGVNYRSTDWNPDGSKYANNFVGGKWKILITGTENATKFFVASWYIEMVDKI